jgi:formiminotetrahydrofolate cyclodeaminase
VALLSTLTLRQLLDALASGSPTPGGGSAAAAAGALGAALLLMATRITRGRPVASIAALSEAGARLPALVDELASLVDRDADAYATWLRARADASGPGSDPTLAMVAMQAATEVPLATLRACSLAIAEAPAITRHSVRSARTDVAVGVELLATAARASAATADANLGSIPDAGYVEGARAEIARLLADVQRAMSSSSGGGVPTVTDSTMKENDIG